MQLWVTTGQLQPTLVTERSCAVEQLGSVVILFQNVHCFGIHTVTVWSQAEGCHWCFVSTHTQNKCRVSRRKISQLWWMLSVLSVKAGQVSLKLSITYVLYTPLMTASPVVCFYENVTCTQSVYLFPLMLTCACRSQSCVEPRVWVTSGGASSTSLWSSLPSPSRVCPWGWRASTRVSPPLSSRLTSCWQAHIFLFKSKHFVFWDCHICWF